MSKASAEVRKDFDRIARAIEGAGMADELRPFERALLGFLPARCGRVLEVGCGHGALTRRVAARADSVLALDLSPEMVRVARALSAAWPNVEYRVADAAAAELPADAFDVVLSAATLHHLPFAPTVRRLAGWVRPGGRLVIQDVVTRPGVRHLPANALALAARVLRGAWPPRRHPLAALYAEHGRGERYLRPDEAARLYRELLPGARVAHHLEWRYTMVWERPAG
ncbi:MAG: class I SAM-dependent methyltransferase [Longimicrobiaceae bacterium]